MYSDHHLWFALEKSWPNVFASASECIQIIICDLSLESLDQMFLPLHLNACRSSSVVCPWKVLTKCLRICIWMHSDHHLWFVLGKSWPNDFASAASDCRCNPLRTWNSLFCIWFGFRSMGCICIHMHMQKHLVKIRTFIHRRGAKPNHLRLIRF